MPGVFGNDCKYEVFGNIDLTIINIKSIDCYCNKKYTKYGFIGNIYG